ncbi:MAG TPA: GNAT family N-acetyltransferase [Bryobacteraceae bacterium]|nr:GNAT family N-acetyltransferase [Bryobacteraceae bacterium]
MGVLEFLPAPRKVLRLLASDPQEFAEEYGVKLHEVAQTVAQHSLEFMRTFSLETPPEWFGHFAIEGESQQMVGVCSLKGPPDGGTVEMAYFTFPGFEGRGIATAMARFVLERARTLPKVKVVMAHTAPEFNASTRILEKIGMRRVGDEEEDGAVVWRWEIAV